jgi:hypothetical protein
MAWGHVVRKFERIGRALLRLLTGARRPRPRLRSDHVPDPSADHGPPPHWVERVLQGAPGLLEPSAREQAEQPAPRPATPVERSITQPSRRIPGERRMPKATEPTRHPRPWRHWVPRPRTMREGSRATADSSAAEAPAEPESPAHEALTVVRPNGRTTVRPEPKATVAEPIVVHDEPPEPTRPPAASVLRHPSLRVQPAAAAVAESASVPRPRRLEPISVLRPAAQRRDWCLTPLVSDTPFGSPLHEARRPAPPLTDAHPLDSRISVAWPDATARSHEVDARPHVVRNSWPDLPPPAFQHDVDLDIALRAWARERRVDREQARL